MMTLQEIYTRVREHLLTQNKQCSEPPDETSSMTSCLYRKGTLSCAVGYLIKDEFYTPRLERCPVADVGVVRALVSSGVLPETGTIQNAINLLEELQRIHDHGNVDLWLENLCELAVKFDLTY